MFAFIPFLIAEAFALKLSEFCSNPQGYSDQVNVDEVDIPFSQCSIKDFSKYDIKTNYFAIKKYLDQFRTLRLDHNIRFTINNVESGDILIGLDIVNAKVSLYLASNVSYISSTLNINSAFGTKLDIYGGSFRLIPQEHFEIIHTNDIHCNYEQTESSRVGFARFVSFIKEERRNKNVLVFDAGDFFQGQPICNLNYGLPGADFINFAQYDAVSPGNHFFDFNQTSCRNVIERAKSPYITSNVEDTNGLLNFHKYLIKTVGSLKFGIFGLTTPYTPILTRPANTDGIIFHKDLINITKAMTKELRSQGCDIIIMLSHLGCTAKEYTSTEIAENFDGVDLIIDGHSHTTLPNGSYIFNNDYQTLVVQTGSKMKYVGVLDFVYDIKHKRIVGKKDKLLGYSDFNKYQPDIETQKYLDDLIEKTRPLSEKVVGHTNVDLLPPNAGYGIDSYLSELITTAFLKGTVRNEQRSDVSFLNAGGVRGNLTTGDIRWSQLFTLMPYGNALVTFEITGKDLVEALAYGTDGYGEKYYSKFPQVSGITYSIDMSKTGTNRIHNIKFVDYEGNFIKDFKIESTYTITTIDYLAEGGEGYDMFAGHKYLKANGIDVDTTISFIQSLPDQTINGNEKFLFTRVTASGEYNKQSKMLKEAEKEKIITEGITVRIHDGTFDALGTKIAKDFFQYTVSAENILTQNLDDLQFLSPIDNKYIDDTNIIIGTNQSVLAAGSFEGIKTSIDPIYQPIFKPCSNILYKSNSDGMCVLNVIMIALMALTAFLFILIIVLSVLIVKCKHSVQIAESLKQNMVNDETNEAL